MGAEAPQKTRQERPAPLDEKPTGHRKKQTGKDGPPKEAGQAPQQGQRKLTSQTPDGQPGPDGQQRPASHGRGQQHGRRQQQRPPKEHNEAVPKWGTSWKNAQSPKHEGRQTTKKIRIKQQA